MFTATGALAFQALNQVEKIPVFYSDQIDVQTVKPRIHLVVQKDLNQAVEVIRKLSGKTELLIWTLNPMVQEFLSELWGISVGYLRPMPVKSQDALGIVSRISAHEIDPLVSRLLERRHVVFRGITFFIPQLGQLESVDQFLHPKFFVVDALGVYSNSFPFICGIQIPRWFGWRAPSGFKEGIADLLWEYFSKNVVLPGGFEWKPQRLPTAVRQTLPAVSDVERRFEYFTLSKSGVLPIMTRGLGPGTWKSLRTVVTSQNAGWVAFQKHTSMKCYFLPEDERIQFLDPRIRLSCRQGVFSYLSPRAFRICSQFFPKMRRRIFHLHGEASHGLVGLGDALRQFSKNDIFICSSNAEALALKGSLLGATAFGITPPLPRPVSCKARSRYQKRFVYIGRVNPLKNIHGLICAYAKLKQKNGLKAMPRLDIIGPWDSQGLHRAGLPRTDYQKFLSQLIERLSLSEDVRIHSEISEKEVLRVLSAPGGILVSASISPDEDFGLVAAQGLSLGRSAVLSNWGGHLDHRKNFPRQVLGVSVYQGSFGPFVDITEFAKQMDRSLRMIDQNLSELQPQTPTRFARAIHRIVKKSAHRSSTVDLTPGRASLLLIARARRDSSRNVSTEPTLFEAKVFRNFGDPLAAPFQKAYGSKNTRQKMKIGKKVLFPNVKIDSGTIRIQNPLYGEICFKRRALGPSAIRTLSLHEQIFHMLSSRDFKTIVEFGGAG